MPQSHFLTFENAVELTNQLIDVLNSGELDDFLGDMAKKFNQRLKPNRRFHVDEINRNCPECSGCHSGGCILGCFKHGHGSASVLCYWDQALEEIIGTRLVIHEIFHLIFEQAFENDLSEKDHFDLSEEFAMFGEKNFNPHLQFEGEHVYIDTLTLDEIGRGITNGFLWGIGFSALIVLLFFVFGKTPYSITKKK